MNIFSLFSVLGGLAFFLYGMTVLSNSLQKTAGGKLESMLGKLTVNPFLGLIFGMVITIAIQSSSAMTVMLVGFVNSGIMEVGKTISVIMGSDIGTTLTAWILSLTGVSGDNVFIKLLNPKYFAPVVALIGVILIMTSKKEKRKNVGFMLIGFAILMTGMAMMSDGMSPFAETPQFARLLLAFSHPIVSLLIGTAITAVIQSSAATIGVLQALSLTGQITYAMAIPLVMGANIGTCMTAILSSIGVTRKAKRVAAIHVAIKVIGAVIVLILYEILRRFMLDSILQTNVHPVSIALIHTVFNLVIVLILFPFCSRLEKLVARLIPDKEEDKQIFLDERLLVTPTVALSECERAMMEMTDVTEASLNAAIELFDTYSDEKMDFVRRNEDLVDNYEDQIGKFLMKLNATTNGLGRSDSQRASKILHGINEFERQADHALNLAFAAQEIHEKDLSFSKEGKAQLDNLLAAVREIYTTALVCFRKNKEEAGRNCEALQGVIDVMCETYKESHFIRLQKGECSTLQGFVFNDILTHCGRISDHSMNIAAAVLRTLDTRAVGEKGYLHDIKAKTSEEYLERYEQYYKKYMQPES